jgi:hypothetical protein
MGWRHVFRPPHIPPTDVLDIAGRNASELIGLHHSIIDLNNTIVRLRRIVDAKRPPDGEDDDPDFIPF